MDFKEYDWVSKFSGINADEAAERFTDIIMRTLRGRVRCKFKQSAPVRSFGSTIGAWRR